MRLIGHVTGRKAQRGRSVATMLLLGATAVVLAAAPVVADQLRGDADILIPGQANNVAVTQAAGTSATYTFSAEIANTGGSTDNVFPGTVSVGVTRSDPWASSPGGTPASLSLTAYATPATGTVIVTIPECTTPETIEDAVVVDLAAGTSTNGKTLDANASSIRFTYDVTITAGTCVPVNNPPSDPGPPALSSGATPNKTGQFSLGWDASTDPEGGSVTYTLEHRDNDDLAWSQVATNIATNSYTFASGNAEPEGTWSYRVKASDGTNSSGYTESAPGIVVVDKSAPNAPNLDPDRDAEYQSDPDWWRSTVTVSFSSAGDPDLSDLSPGSGVDPDTVPAAVQFSTTGAHLASGSVLDEATNQSVLGTLTVHVDATRPVVAPSCPAFPVVKDSTASASWTASDVGSGLATADNGTLPLDTTSVGTKTATFPAGTAQDNVGLQSLQAQCSYSVVFNWTGFFNPVDNPTAINVAKAGSGIPVKFSLGGDQGLGIMAAGYPTSNTTTCGAAASDDAVESTVTAGQSSLHYDGLANQYVYVWKTEKAWAGTCRQLRVKLIDGTLHVANFRFTK